ncbi:MAG: bleomycin resistance protein [Thermoleophilia bacterium]|nr:bleomycin resistance protein [Thermoleophilia bacterium]
MPDRATPNLPSRDLAATSLFYAGLGFAEAFRDDGWMILTRGDLVLEFFPWAGLDPAANPCGCCLRLADVDAFAAACRDAGVPEATNGFPRLHPPRPEPAGLRIGALLDPDGSLLRLVGDPATADG